MLETSHYSISDLAEVFTVSEADRLSNAAPPKPRHITIKTNGACPLIEEELRPARPTLNSKDKHMESVVRQIARRVRHFRVLKSGMAFGMLSGRHISVFSTRAGALKSPSQTLLRYEYRRSTQGAIGIITNRRQSG